MSRKPDAAVSFPAAFSPNRKCLQADADGEVTLTLVVPETHAGVALALWQTLRDTPFRVEVRPDE